MSKARPYRQGGVLIQLVFGTDSKTCIIAASCPGQLDRRLQVAVHLLIDGAAKLCAVITEIREQNIQRTRISSRG